MLKTTVCPLALALQAVCVINDPIINGFDGSTFHFDEIGEYVMLESGDGYKVIWLANLNIEAYSCPLGCG